LSRKEQKLTPSKFNPNNPSLWKDFDPFASELTYVDGKSERYINVSKANRIKAQDPDWKEARDRSTSTPEYKASLKAGKEKFWQNAPESHRRHIAKKAADANLTFSSKEQAEEIFWKCWAEDRGEKLYKKLAKEYNVSFHGIISLVRGNFNKTIHLYCPVSYEKLEEMKADWEQRYKSITIVAVRPGYEHLDNYDRLYRESAQYEKVHDAWKKTLPSVVFHCRYILPTPTPQSVRDYCNNIGIPQLKNDLGQYKKILNEQFTWLRNDPAEVFEFKSYEDLGEFLTLHPDNKEGLKFGRERANEKIHDRISWRSKSFQGWMFYVKEI
jgi:hypothetical protein